jgi:hypothetical protein
MAMDPNTPVVAQAIMDGKLRLLKSKRPAAAAAIVPSQDCG